MSIINHGHGAGGAGFPHPLDPAGKQDAQTAYRAEGIKNANELFAAMANQDTVAETLAQRAKTYGDFTHHAAICQDLKDSMQFHAYSNWSKKLSDVQKQALEVIVDKIARILTGDPDYRDNWHDIQGYAKLAEERLPCNAGKPTIVERSAIFQTKVGDTGERRRSSDVARHDDLGGVNM